MSILKVALGQRQLKDGGRRARCRMDVRDVAAHARRHLDRSGIERAVSGRGVESRSSEQQSAASQQAASSIPASSIPASELNPSERAQSQRASELNPTSLTVPREEEEVLERGLDKHASPSERVLVEERVGEVPACYAHSASQSVGTGYKQSQ